MGWLTGNTDDRGSHTHLLEQGLLSNDRDQAWHAAWELISLNDPQVKTEAIAMLRTHIAAASRPASPRSNVMTVEDIDELNDPTWQRAELALAIEEAIEHSNDRTRRRILSSREVRKHGEREQARVFRESMHKLGVRQGEGLPMWMLYLSRRDRKNW